MGIYPENWPRCPKCGDFALDGHVTCGRFECNEGETRRAQSRPPLGDWWNTPEAD